MNWSSIDLVWIIVLASFILGYQPKGKKQVGLVTMAGAAFILVGVARYAALNALGLVIIGFAEHQFLCSKGKPVLSVPKGLSIAAAIGIGVSLIVGTALFISRDGGDIFASPWSLILMFSGIVVCVAAGMWASVGWISLRKKQIAE